MAAAVPMHEPAKNVRVEDLLVQVKDNNKIPVRRYLFQNTPTTMQRDPIAIQLYFMFLALDLLRMRQNLPRLYAAIFVSNL
ncbi:MAG: hypothetical protein HWD59_03140 [Coxiellaceae bacterium]|nr:MAG: hypothetical protein HWD59_03140 [Coxiellaceae bacterium]